MPCVSLTVTAPKPVVEQLSTYRNTTGSYFVQWVQNIAGQVGVKKDGVLAAWVSGIAGTNNYNLGALAPGTYNICVEPA